MAVDTPDSARLSPFRERRKVIVAVAVLALLTGIFETATIVMIVAFIEGVTSGDLEWEVATGPLDVAVGRGELVALAVVALVGATVGQTLITWLKARAVASWQYAMQMRAASAFVHSAWSTQSSQTSGSLQNLMSLAWGSAQGLLGLMNLLSAGGAVLIMSCAAFVASPLAAAALIGTGVVLMVALQPLRSASREATRRATLAQLAVSDRVGEIHDLAQEIRVFGAEDAVVSDMRRSGRNLRRERERAALLTGLGAVAYRSLGLSLVLAAAMIASGAAEIDVARVGVAGLLLLRSLSYGQTVQTAWQTIENNRPYIDQLGEALDRYDRESPDRGNEPATELGDIELRGVTYSYGGSATPALGGIDVTITHGEMLGVVGPSGSGKSTLAQVLLGLREPTAGTYLASGRAVMSIAAADWFRLVSVVPQQPRLLRASVLDNIAFHRPWISADAARRAAAKAGLHDEILELPDGYETPIGDAVRDLSGGQRQRLGIARALAGDPRLLVLDEPTSALDALSESRIQETLGELRGRVTVVIIAHRLATLNHCDRLLVLEAGVVQAIGEPNVVMKQNDFYRAASRMQLVSTNEAPA